MKMIIRRQEELLTLSLVIVGFFSTSAYGQQPRRPGDRVIAAQDIPLTNFTCIDKTPGYYADVETGCQVYHMCTDGGRQFSYRCPNTTLFQQRMLICAHWYQVNCSRSEQDYTANLLIGQRDKPFVDESEHVNINFNNDNEYNALNNPDDLQRLGTNGNGGGRVHSNNFLQSTRPGSNNIPHISVQPTQGTFKTTHPVVSTNQVHFSPPITTFTPVSFIPTHRTNPTFISTNNPFVTFNTQVTTTPFPTTYNDEFDKTTVDYFDEEINNSYNNFINRFIPELLNDTDINFTNAPTTISSTSTTLPFIQNTVLNNTTFVPKLRSTTLTTPLSFNLHPNNDFSSFNNFITRFVPEVNDTDVDSESSDFEVEHRFLKRFNPDEIVPGSNYNPLNNNNQNNFKNQQNIPSFINSNLLINKLSQNLGNVENLMPPIQEPSKNLELPLQSEFEDNDHMESNILELKFQDPRQVFFIPDNDNQRIPPESTTPITVSIPRRIRPSQQLRPMLFVNSVTDVCKRCHQAFVIDRVNCSPCVVIR